MSEIFIIVNSDGYYQDVATPIVYESKKKFLEDLKDAAIKHKSESHKRDRCRFMFIDFDPDEVIKGEAFGKDLELYTLEDWIKDYGDTQEDWIKYVAELENNQ